MSPPAGDTNSVMTVLPTFNLPSQVECFRLVHMVDNSGFPFPMDTIELRPLVWAWTLVLLRLQKVGHTAHDCGDCVTVTSRYGICTFSVSFALLGCAG